MEILIFPRFNWARGDVAVYAVDLDRNPRENCAHTAHMNRRDILRSTAAVVTASTVGLAGCLGSDGGGNSSCEVPSGDLEDDLPDSSDYTVQDQVRVIEESTAEEQEREVSAFYNGPDGQEIVFQIVEYSSETIAAEETNTVSEQGSGYAGSVGYIQTGAYIISAIGADESSVKAILKATPLSDGCVEDNVEFA